MCKLWVSLEEGGIMNHETFRDMVMKRLGNCEDVLYSKSEEYSTRDDKLHNFRVAARYDNEDRSRALWGMLKKHIVSIHDEIVKMDADRDFVPGVSFQNDKITDVINYCLLLEAIVTEKQQFKKETEDGHN
jgi:hypothetical protein